MPDEDQGYFFVIVQAPPGASLQYTTKHRWTKRAAILSQNHDIEGVFSVPGFSFTGSAPNRGMIFANLKRSSERKGKAHSACRHRERSARAVDEHPRAW